MLRKAYQGKLSANVASKSVSLVETLITMDVVERKMMLDLEIGLTKTKKMSKIVQSVELELKRMEDAII